MLYAAACSFQDWSEAEYIVNSIPPKELIAFHFIWCSAEFHLWISAKSIWRGYAKFWYSTLPSESVQGKQSSASGLLRHWPWVLCKVGFLQKKVKEMRMLCYFIDQAQLPETSRARWRPNKLDVNIDFTQEFYSENPQKMAARAWMSAGRQGRVFIRCPPKFIYYWYNRL